jgi:hypothetical protein
MLIRGHLLDIMMALSTDLFKVAWALQLRREKNMGLELFGLTPGCPAKRRKEESAWSTRRHSPNSLLSASNGDNEMGYAMITRQRIRPGCATWCST